MVRHVRQATDATVPSASPPPTVFHMLPPFLRLFLALGFATLAAAEPRLRIGVETADNPISFVDAQGRPTGFTAELLAAMGRAGLGDVDLVAKHWSRLIEDFDAGRLDALANVAATEERLRHMDFSISHAYVHGLVYNRRDRPPILTTADFAGKTIGTLSGSISLINALAHGGWGATIKPFVSPQAALDATQRGEIDGTLLIYGLEGKYVTNNHGLRREFVDDILHHFRFAVHKGDTATLTRLNDALATIRHNGVFDGLYDQWIGPIEPHPIRLADLRPYAKPIGLGLLAVALVIWWQRHMLARVSRHARALRESEERFHLLVDSAFEGWVINQNGHVVMANPAFAATFGFTNAELIGKSVVELTAPAFRSDLTAAMQSGQSSHYETLGLRKDGTQIPVAISSQPCTFHGQPARIAAVRDLTAQKQAAADQLVLSKLESTGILAGGIAHDFNNLLATMVLSVDMVLLTQRNSADNVRYLESIKSASAAAKTLTQQLITFARGGASARQPADLALLLHRSVPLALSGSNVHVEISAAPDLAHAEIDAGQIERVIGNLVLNAREALPAGGTISVRAENAVLRPGEVAALPAGDYVRLDVVDRGHGIPADVLPKIFDPYFSTKERGVQKGMGLGLTISHSIVHQHGGALTVESTAGVGTTFHLYLPATRLPLAPPPSAPAEPVACSGRILVMDDEAGLRETVQLALEHAGYAVTLAAEGGTAIDLYQKARAEGRPFDAVLLDLTVRGGLGGLETMQALLQLDPAVKAVVMSGYAQETVLRDYAQHGFRGALPKPFDIATLCRTLAHAAAG